MDRPAELPDDPPIFRIQPGGEERPASPRKPLRPPGPPSLLPRADSSAAKEDTAAQRWSRGIYAFRKEGDAPLHRGASEDERDFRAGAWICVGLFVVVLVSGLALGVYTFLGPFAPPGWLR